MNDLNHITAKNGVLLMIISIAFTVLSCAPAIEEKKPADMGEPMIIEKLPLEKQVENSKEIFGQILEMTAAADRKEILPDMELAYKKIIDECPDAPLAQESYWRLILINIEDYSPPKPEKAESLYKELAAKYPDSRFKRVSEETFMRFYYESRMWDKLIVILTPHIKEYITTGKLYSPYYLFLYSEAKLNLGSIVEAEKGYKIIRELFPKSAEARMSKNRLEEIQNSKK